MGQKVLNIESYTLCNKWIPCLQTVCLQTNFINFVIIDFVNKIFELVDSFISLLMHQVYIFLWESLDFD